MSLINILTCSNSVSLSNCLSLTGGSRHKCKMVKQTKEDMELEKKEKKAGKDEIGIMAEGSKGELLDFFVFEDAVY